MMRKIWKLMLLTCCVMSSAVCFADLQTEQPVLEGIKITESQSLDFTGKKAPSDKAVVGEYVNQTTPFGKIRYAGLLSYNTKSDSWDVLYHRDYPGAYPKMQVCQLMTNKLDQVIFSTQEGSGGYLSYQVLAWLNEQPQVLLQRKGIFQGSCRVENHKLIEKMGHQTTVYKWNGNTMVPYETQQEVVESVGSQGIRLTFSITGNTVYVSQHQVTLKVGQKLQLVRMNRGTRERVLYSGGRNLEFHPDYVTAKAPGQFDISIIPNGYDWKNAAKIQVTVIA